MDLLSKLNSYLFTSASNSACAFSSCCSFSSAESSVFMFSTSFSRFPPFTLLAIKSPIVVATPAPQATSWPYKTTCVFLSLNMIVPVKMPWATLKKQRTTDRKKKLTCWLIGAWTIWRSKSKCWFKYHTIYKETQQRHSLAPCQQKPDLRGLFRWIVQPCKFYHNYNTKPQTISKLNRKCVGKKEDKELVHA